MKEKNEKSCARAGMQHSKPMIFIEGNVGVGKSSLLKFLHENLNLDVFYEPTDLWENIEGHDLLEAFFLDQKRWAYTFQSYVLITNVDQMILADTKFADKVCLVERSVYSGRYFFAQLAQEIGTMNQMEWSLYTTLWQREVARIQRPPAGFVYLRIPSEISYQRILSRGRKEENPITMDYLKRLEEKHENWFIKKIGMPDFLKEVPVLVLDFSQDFRSDIALQNQYQDLILDFIAKTEDFLMKNNFKL